jgi:hypothetical protein
MGCQVASLSPAVDQYLSRRTITLHGVAELIVFSLSLLQGTLLIPFLGIDQLSSCVTAKLPDCRPLGHSRMIHPGGGTDLYRVRCLFL